MSTSLQLELMQVQPTLKAWPYAFKLVCAAFSVDRERKRSARNWTHSCVPRRWTSWSRRQASPFKRAQGDS